MIRKILAGLVVAALFALMPSIASAQVNGAFVLKVPALTNTAVQPKLSIGTLQWINCNNPNASIVWIQVYDSAGTITVGTTPPKFYVALDASKTTYIPLNAAMLNGIQLAATTTPTGGTAPGSAAICAIAFN